MRGWVDDSGRVTELVRQGLDCRTDDIGDDGETVPDSGKAGSWSRVMFCWVYKEGGELLGAFDSVRLLDLDTSLCLRPLLLEITPRLSLSFSLVRRVRTEAEEVG